MKIPVGVVVGVAPAGALLRQPRVEPRRHQAVGALLLLRGAGGEVVGVFVLRVPVMAANPMPFDGMSGRGLHQLLPERKVLDGPRLPLPAPRLPTRDPLVHAFDQILGVGDVPDVRALPLPVEPLEGGDGAGERHAVIGRLGCALVEVPPGHRITGPRFDQGRVPARVRRRGPVAQAALIRVDDDERQVDVGHQGWTMTGRSVCLRMSSAWEITWLGRSVERGTWAPANRQSAPERRTTAATTSPGFPISTCVTKRTPCNERRASAAPTTVRPSCLDLAA